MSQSNRSHVLEVVMGPKGSKLILAVLVFLAACPPLSAAPQAKKPAKTVKTVAAPATAATSTAVEAADSGAIPGTLTLTPGQQVMNPRLDSAHGIVPDVLRLYPNESKIIRVEGLKRVSITNQDVADVVIVSPEEIMVLPNKGGLGGRTSAYFWDKDGRKEIRIVVIARNEEKLIAEQIQKDINLPNIAIEYINNRTILRGKVRNPTEKNYAKDIAGLYGAPILDLLEVEGIAMDPKEALIKLLNLPDVKITVVNTALQASAAQLAPAQPAVQQAPQATNERLSITPPMYVSGSQTASSFGSAGSAPGPVAPSQSSTPGLPTAAPPQTVMVLLEGTVDDEQDKARADEITKAFFAASSIGANWQAATVINHIEVVKPVQVLVEGMLLELKNDNSRQFDFKWGTNQVAAQAGAEFQSPAGAIPETNFNRINFMETPVGNTLGQFTHTGGRLSSNDWWLPFPFPMERLNRMDPLLLSVNWALQTGKARLVSSPKIITRSGQEAKIDVGGTVPIPTAAGLGVTGVQLLRYGTQMRITPVVDHRGNIDTKVQISVSDAGRIAGETSNRDTETRVTVKDGEHIVVSGLVQNKDQLAVTKVPFFGDIPWVGRLFQTKTTSKQNIETVAIVTPRLLDAVRKDEMFANSKYGDQGPTDADLKAANKGGKKGAVDASMASAPVQTPADSAISRARNETASRLAKLDTASSTGQKSAPDAELTERQLRVRAMFGKLKSETEATPVPRRVARVPRPVTPRPATSLTEPGDDASLPLMAGPAPIPAPASTAFPEMVASSGMPVPPAEVVRTSPVAEDNIERVSRKIDDLFDKIDRGISDAK